MAILHRSNSNNSVAVRVARQLIAMSQTTYTHTQAHSAPDYKNEMYESISAVCDKRTRAATQRHARQQQQQQKP